MGVTFEEALRTVVGLLHEVGPMTDCEPDEFAVQWVKEANSGDLEDLVQEARVPATYEIGPDGRQWGLFFLEMFFEAWAGHNAEGCLERMSPLLTQSVGRAAAFVALEAVVRNAFKLAGPATLELNRVHPTWNPPLDADERSYLKSLVESIQRLSAEGSGILDPELTAIAGLD